MPSCKPSSWVVVLQPPAWAKATVRAQHVGAVGLAPQWGFKGPVDGHPVPAHAQEGGWKPPYRGASLLSCCWCPVQQPQHLPGCFLQPDRAAASPPTRCHFSGSPPAVSAGAVAAHRLLCCTCSQPSPLLHTQPSVLLGPVAGAVHLHGARGGCAGCRPSPPGSVRAQPCWGPELPCRSLPALGEPLTLPLKAALDVLQMLASWPVACPCGLLGRPLLGNPCMGCTAWGERGRLSQVSCVCSHHNQMYRKQQGPCNLLVKPSAFTAPDVWNKRSC